MISRFNLRTFCHVQHHNIAVVQQIDLCCGKIKNSDQIDFGCNVFSNIIPNPPNPLQEIGIVTGEANKTQRILN